LDFNLKKRLLASGMAAVLTLGGLSACGESEEPEEQQDGQLDEENEPDQDNEDQNDQLDDQIEQDDSINDGVDMQDGEKDNKLNEEEKE
jgi:hypothetical protein